MTLTRRTAAVVIAALWVSGCVGTTLPLQPRTTSPPAPAVIASEAAPTASPPAPTATDLAAVLSLCRDERSTSPDNLQIAFDAKWDGDSEVYSVRADGSDLRQITSNSTADVNPAWSPDGQRIAYVADLREPRLYIAQADGSSPRLLGPDFEISSLEVEWSPDGELVAFRNLDDLYVMNTTTGELTLLTGATDTVPGRPMFSPDGSLVGFAAEVRGGNPGDALFVVNTDGTSLTKVAFLEDASILRAAWRPHQDQVLLETTSPTDGTALYLSGLDGTIAKLPVASDSFAPEPAWSPDGSLLGYVMRADAFDSQGQPTTRDSLHIATPDGEVDVEVLAPPGEPGTPFPMAEFVWAPDGRHIAYSMHKGGDALDLFVLDICNGASVPVVQEIGLFSTPSWRPLP